MPVIGNRYGHFDGLSNQDARVIVQGPGAKEALAIVVSWERDNHTALAANNFYGVLWVLSGAVANAGGPAADVTTTNHQLGDPLVLFKHIFRDQGPTEFFLPIAALQGLPATAQGGPITIIAGRGIATAGETFTAHLTVAGSDRVTV